MTTYRIGISDKEIWPAAKLVFDIESHWVIAGFVLVSGLTLFLIFRKR